MPKPDGIIDALKLARSFGQMPFGHFDHDADCAIGPYIAPASPSVEAVRAEADPTAVKYERYEDPRTRELLYRVVKG